jgi:hypothetical protein
VEINGDLRLECSLVIRISVAQQSESASGSYICCSSVRNQSTTSGCRSYLAAHGAQEQRTSEMTERRDTRGLSCLRTSTVLSSISRVFSPASVPSNVIPLSIYWRTKRPRIEVPSYGFAEYSPFATCIGQTHPSRWRSWFESGLYWFSDRFASLNSFSSFFCLFHVATDGGHVASFNNFNITNIIGASNTPGTILSHPSISSMIDWFFRYL